MALDVGHVVARFETRFESAGVDRFERRITEAEARAKETSAAVSHAGGGFRKLGEDAALAGRELETAGARGQRAGLGLHKLGTEASGAGEHVRKTGGHIKSLALSFLGFGGAIGLEEAIRKSNERLGELQTTSAQTGAVLKSTGDVAHVTAGHVDELAVALGRKSGVDHEQIVQGENLLLTYRTIRDEAGKNNDVFTQTVKVIQDVAAARHMDVVAASAQVGKAINDPANGMSRLLRLGITFTDQQKAQAKQLVATGHTQEAQRLILDQLSKSFGGSAQAAGHTMPAALNRAKIAAEDLGASLLKKLAPSITTGAGKIAKFITQMQDGQGAGGRFAKKVSDIAKVVGTVGGHFVDAAGDVGRFFAHHTDLLKIAGTMAGIAASVKIIGKLGNVTGVTSLLKLAAGVGRGGLLGEAVSTAKPIPVYVVNNLPGGAGGAAGALERDAETAAAADAGAGAAGGAAVTVLGGAAAAVAIVALGKLGATQYHPWDDHAMRQFGAGVGMAPSTHTAPVSDAHHPIPVYHSTIAPGPAVVGVAATSRGGQAIAPPASFTTGLQSWAATHRDDANAIAKVRDGLALLAKQERAASDEGKNPDARKEYEAKRAALERLLASLRSSPSSFRGINQSTDEAGGRVAALITRLSGLKTGTDAYRTTARQLEQAQGELNDKIGGSGSSAEKRVEALRIVLSHLDRGTDAYRSTARQLRSAQDTLNRSLFAADNAGRKGASGIYSIAGGALSASSAVEGAAATIAANVSSLASQLGAQGISFTPAKTPAGRQTQLNQFGLTLPDFSGPGAARGGMFVGGSAGARGRDDRLLLGADGRPEAVVGAGELLVFNGDQQAALDGILSAVGAGGLGGFFALPWRDHATTPTFAGGGMVPDVSILGPGGGYSRDANAASRAMDRAAEAKIRKLANAPINRMIRFGQAIASKHWPYVYGGGHGGFTGPYDCSGFVSAILHAGGLMPGGPMTTDGLKNYGAAGDGARVTIGVRGTTGRSAHTMIKVGNHYFESGGGHGAAEDAGWDGNFPIHRHPQGYAGGGQVVDLEELPPAVRDLIERNPELLDPRHPAFVGFGLTGGGLLGRVRRFAKGGAKKSIPAAKHLAAAAHHAAAKINTGGAADKSISAAGDSYGRLERRQGLTDEVLIVTHDDGTVSIDKTAQARAQAEVKARIDAKTAIKRKVAAALQSTDRSIRQAAKARTDIEKALHRIPTTFAKTKAGKAARAAAARLRASYKQRLDAYSTTLGDLRDRRTGLKGQGLDLGLDIAELGKEQAGYSDSALQAQLPAAAPATLDTSLTGDEQNTLEALTYQASQAQLTPDDATDDESARSATEKFWRGVLDRLKRSGASTAVLTEATNALAGTLPGATGSSPSSPTADQAAVNAQLQTQLQTAQRAAAINAAAVAAFGSSGDVGSGYANAYTAAADEGGWMTRSGAPAPAAAPAVVQNNYMLTPSDPAVLLAVGQAATAGIGYQGAPTSPRQPATL